MPEDLHSHWCTRCGTFFHCIKENCIESKEESTIKQWEVDRCEWCPHFSDEEAFKRIHADDHIPLFERQDDGTLKRLVGIAIYSSPKDMAMLEEERLKKKRK